MRNLYIYCDGGFGNRYGTLLGGLIFAEKHNLNPVINWRDSRWCRLPFNSIFQSDLDVMKEKTLHHFDDCIRLMHENTDGVSMHENINNISSIDAIEIDDRYDYVYNNNWIPPWMDMQSVIKVSKNLKFLDSLKNVADIFANKKGINSFTVGVHLRATDFNTYIPKFDKEYQWIEQQPEQKFFVLSDDPNVERKFNTLSNVVIHKKQHYVEKINSGASTWCENIERSSDSVVDSLIDLLLLSKTNILINSPSSFLKTALLLQKAHG